MARIRTIKPNFFTSEDIVRLSPLARLLYIATWMEADREGRMAWRPGTLKLRYLPGDDCDVLTLAQELIDAGLIVLYEADGTNLACIPTFTRHQVINNRETPSSLPEPPSELLTRAARVTRASPTRDDATGTPLVGKEGNGKEGSDDASLTRDGSRRPTTAADLLPEVDAQVLADWLQVRKAKRAGPVTATVVRALKSEADKAGLGVQRAVEICCGRGWQSFNASWNWSGAADGKSSHVGARPLLNADELFTGGRA